MPDSTCFNAILKKALCLILIIIIATALSLKAQHAISTLCGTSTQGNPLAGPNGICASPDGQFLYLADYSAHRIKKINTSSGSVVNYAGTGVAGHNDGALLNAGFYYPSGIKISSDGQGLYIADNANCLIRRINILSSAVTTIAGVYNAYSFADSSNGLAAQFNQPVDLVIAPGDSILYVSDSENHIIRKIDLISSAVSTIAGMPGVGGFADGIGTIARFHNPNGLTISSDGLMLYVADAGNHRIRKVNLVTKEVTTLAGSGIQGNANSNTGTLASFNIPQGVVILPGDSILYVIDTFNNLIRQININTTAVTTVAGTTSTFSSHFADNANGLLAKFWHPVNAILSANAAQLYISDQENYRIRQMQTDLPVAINSISESDLGIVLYPNPASDNLIMTSKKNELNKYEIISMDGRTIFSENLYGKVTSVHINLNHLHNGMYILRAASNNDFSFLTFVINK